MNNKASRLISPWGGKLVNLLVPPDELEEARARAATLPSIQLSERAICDLELLATGGFSPLKASCARRITNECWRKCA